MKILVTGSAGFIGFHLVKKLHDRSDRVVGIDNINDYYHVSLKYVRLAETGISYGAEQWYMPETDVTDFAKAMGYIFDTLLEVGIGRLVEGYKSRKLLP